LKVSGKYGDLKFRYSNLKHFIIRNEGNWFFGNGERAFLKTIAITYYFILILSFLWIPGSKLIGNFSRVYWVSGTLKGFFIVLLLIQPAQEILKFAVLRFSGIIDLKIKFQQTIVPFSIQIPSEGNNGELKILAILLPFFFIFLSLTWLAYSGRGEPAVLFSTGLFFWLCSQNDEMIKLIHVVKSQYPLH